jgi:hypothetical protein
MPPIIPRERFGAGRRDLLRVGDILIGQVCADTRPCILLNLAFASTRSAALPRQIRAKAPRRRGCSERPPEVYYIKGHSRAAAIPINEAMEIVGKGLSPKNRS